MAKFRNGSKGGFEPGLMQLIVSLAFYRPPHKDRRKQTESHI